MADQNIVSITIEEDLESRQENTSLKIELDEDTSIQQLLEYLIEQDKIVVTLDRIEVLSGQNVISNKSCIRDAISNGNKVDLVIRVKNNKNIPPPPVVKPNPVVVQTQKNPMNKSNIESSTFDIPVTGSLEQSKLHQKEQQQKRLQQQQAKFIAAKEVAQQKAPIPSQQTLILVIAITDGSNEISIEFQVGATQCWDDIKPRLFDQIAAKKYVAYWSNNGHVYKKAKIPFKNLNMAVNGKIKFQITRIFPGGSQ